MRLYVTGTGKGRSEPVDASRVVNMYVEQSRGKSQAVLHGAPGLTLSQAYGNGPVRGIKYMGGSRYVVSGGTLYGPSGSIGGIEGSGRVFMATNGVQLAIVSDSKTYVYQTTLNEITDPDFPIASSVDYLDGYFLFTEKDTGIFFISALNDATDYDALDFASAESAPDNLLRVFVDHREVWLMGTETCEIWVNTGNADFPFERVEGAINEKGLRGSHTVTKTDNSLYWLDRDLIVRRAEGYNPIRISTHDIEHKIAKGDADSAHAFSYVIEGHEFYCLTVPGAGTFEYDAATNEWHERESYQKNYWRVSGFDQYQGIKYVGDDLNGNVYKIDLDANTENGDYLIAEMVFPPINMDGQRFRVNSVQLDMETGVSASPKVMMSTSKDGRVWSNEKWVDFGPVGSYDKRVVWRRLGLYRDCHLRFRISDNAKRAVYTAYVDVG